MSSTVTALELFMPLDGETPVKVKPLPTASATVGWLVTIRRIAGLLLAAMLGRNERSCGSPFFSEGKLEKY